MPRKQFRGRNRPAEGKDDSPKQQPDPGASHSGHSDKKNFSDPIPPLLVHMQSMGSSQRTATFAGRILNEVARALDDNASFAYPVIKKPQEMLTALRDFDIEDRIPIFEYDAQGNQQSTRGEDIYVVGLEQLIMPFATPFSVLISKMDKVHILTAILDQVICDSS